MTKFEADLYNGMRKRGVPAPKAAEEALYLADGIEFLVKDIEEHGSCSSSDAREDGRTGSERPAIRK